jgi:hypothetical protein
VCSYDGDTFLIGGIPVPFSEPGPEWSDELLNLTFRNVPRVQQELARGSTISDAVHTYDGVLDSLRGCVRMAFLAGGLEAAATALTQSSLVERAVVKSQDMIMVTYVGLPFEHSLQFGTSSARLTPLQDRPREIVDWLMSRLAHEPVGGALFIVSDGGGQTMLTGNSRLQAKAQIEHVRRAGALADLPPGPLGKTDATLLAIHRMIGSGK